MYQLMADVEVEREREQHQQQGTRSAAHSHSQALEHQQPMVQRVTGSGHDTPPPQPHRVGTFVAFMGFGLASWIMTNGADLTN